MQDSMPAFLYIHAELHTPYVTGCFGGRLVQNPHLDKLASEGVVFENVYCRADGGKTRRYADAGQMGAKHAT